MLDIDIFFALSAFMAGFLMFLAPCTLPLVPAYLSFIAGLRDGQTIDKKAHRKIILNSFFYVLGFSVIFILMGILAGLAGVFAGALRQVLVPISGILIIVFALQMMHLLNLKRFFKGIHISMPNQLKPGTPTSAFVIGSAFALGWTPCVGPILATVLLLAGSTETIFNGAIMLAIFSLGLAIPFMLVALLFAQATSYIAKHKKIITYTEFIGGLFLLLIGVLLLTNNFALTIEYGYKFLNFVGIGGLLDYY